MTYPEQTPGAPVHSPLPESPAAAPRDEDKVMLVLAYFGILALIPFLVSKEPYVKWHAKQGLTLVAAFVILNIGIFIIGMLPFIGLITLLISPLVGLGYLVVFFVAIVRALKGERWRIPVVADMADKW
jgi:uncharacterized membrane protein